jgi:Na+/H+-dicarboxylate symporter
LLITTTIGASIGSPSTPGVGIVILATILTNIGVPASGIALIIGVDRILDMSRTAINVTGDLTACVVMDRWLPSKPIDREVV